ncbi:hypothetical protein FDP41_011994 [Naegleria fowleri]|uniref:Flavodoxin-like domain-containing protein n=1 Tax=Naegleria fowleri TaxID=5763 RepID=A0A6A5BVP0_NAEFO|nr:uncharacterized protein FDP41_011994 [Naegleria fowleri]KAF0982133.1 hypothetical protein FDP41_011994 [Naegleria fowleri]
MVKVLVLFYSTYRHLWQMAEAIAEGARQVEGAEVHVKRVPETLPAEVLEKMGAIQAQKAFEHVPIASVSELPEYDAIIFGSPTRFGTMSAQLKSFIDACGQLWAKGALVGKVGSFFSSSNTQHGGNETTILSAIPNLLHLGFVYVGLPYSCTLQSGVDEVKGGSPYGATTIAGSMGERLPSSQEKEMAKFQGNHVAQIANKLAK